jgi:hypothetical protein
MARLLRLAAFAAMTTTTTPAHAAYFYNGHDAYGWCVREAQDSVMLANCSGYVTGLLDRGAYDGYDHCMPKTTTVSEIRDAFAAYLTSYPELLDLEAPALFEMAIAEAFPC